MRMKRSQEKSVERFRDSELWPNGGARLVWQSGGKLREEV